MTPEIPDFDQLARRSRRWWFFLGAMSALTALAGGWLVLIALHAKGIL